MLNTQTALSMLSTFYHCERTLTHGWSLASEDEFVDRVRVPHWPIVSTGSIALQCGGSRKYVIWEKQT